MNETKSTPASIGGILLAAGKSSRFGQMKQLINYHGKPLIRYIAKTALTAGLSPVIAVTGFEAASVTQAIEDLPITITLNHRWQDGQSSSLQAGLRCMPKGTSAVLFLLVDQPQVTVSLIKALSRFFDAEKAPIIAPIVNGQRTNPVLFEKVTFPELMKIRGDVGGKMIFDKFEEKFLPWHDERLLLDLDTPDDINKILYS